MVGWLPWCWQTYMRTATLSEGLAVQCGLASSAQCSICRKVDITPCCRDRFLDTVGGEGVGATLEVRELPTADLVNWHLRRQLP